MVLHVLCWDRWRTWGLLARAGITKLHVGISCVACGNCEIACRHALFNLYLHSIEDTHACGEPRKKKIGEEGGGDYRPLPFKRPDWPTVTDAYRMTARLDRQTVSGPPSGGGAAPERRVTIGGRRPTRMARDGSSILEQIKKHQSP